MSQRIVLAMIAGGAFSLLGLAFVASNPAALEAADPQADQFGVPVERDIHEFMEYVNQPVYQRLKSNLSQEPADNAAWTTIKSDALILAETGNLLMLRAPNENQNAWLEHSVSLREAGQEMYQAAKKKDYQATSTEWMGLLQQCNSCHDDFHGGKPNLKP
jgi:hypothetical protein